MFSQYEDGGYKPRDFFGSKDTIPGTIKVAGIETHVMSSLVAMTGTAQHYDKPKNAHNSMSLSSRMEASANAVSEAELKRELASQNEIVPLDKETPIEGAALPSVTPQQLKLLKKKTPRAVSHPGVVPKYRDGDPRSPEAKAMKEKQEAERRASFFSGKSLHPEDLSIDDYRPLPRSAIQPVTEDERGEEKKEGGVHKKNVVAFAGDVVSGRDVDTPPDSYALENKNELRINTGPPSPPKKDIVSDSDSEDSTVYDSDDAMEDQLDSRPQHHLLGAQEEESDEPHFKAGAGGFMEVAPGVAIANPLVASAEETAGRTLEGPPPDDLLCEECSKNIATVYSEVDEELLCQRCCDLLYLPTSSGMQHELVRNGQVRALTGFDRNRLFSRVVQTGEETSMTIPEFEVDEEEMAKIRGFAPDKPSAIEAPSINLVYEAAEDHLNHQDCKFLKGDVVVFAGDELISEAENEKAGHAMWRGKELVGIVMAVPNTRHGAFGSAHRRIAGNEMMYRVKVVRYVTGEYKKFSDRVETRGLFGGIPKGGGVKIIDSSEAVVDPETGEAVKAKLVEEKSRAWRLDKEIENLELERQRAKREYDSEVGSPGTKSRDGNWDVFLANMPAEEPGEMISDISFRYAVVLLPEHDLKYPSEAQHELVESRKGIIGHLIQKLDWKLCEKDYKNTMIWWWHSVVMVGRAKDYNSATVIQKHVRRFQKRFLLQELTAIHDDQVEWVKWWRMHRDFPYERDPELIKRCYNVRGTSIFLPTIAITNRWATLWKRMVGKTVKWMKKKIHDVYFRVMTKWRAEVSAFHNFEEMEYKRKREEEEKALFEANKQAAIDAVAGGRSSKPWHPSVGIVNMKGKLTPLPPMFCKYSPNGALVVEDFPKFNSFRSRQGGPTDTSAWLIPGQLLFGCYPDGKARMKGRQPQHSDSLAQILMTGTGSFVNLMEEEEERAFEIRKGDHLAGQDIAEKLRRRFMLMQSQLMGAVKKCQLIVQQENIEVANMPRYVETDSRYKEAMLKYHEAVAKQGLAIKHLEKAKADLNHFAKEFVFERFPIKEGCSCSDNDSLVSFCENIEQRLRDGERIYIFDRLGHGRVGLLGAILLGRIYGCTAEEALFRVQMYHDSKVSVQVSNRSYSCPQTVDQVAQVKKVLSLEGGMYGTLVMKADEAMITYEAKRRMGAPKLKKGVLKMIDYEELWDQEIGEERGMDEEELEEAVTSSRHHCNATPGQGVKWKAPDYEFKATSVVPLVIAPTLNSLTPLTTVEELREKDDVFVEVLRKPLVQKDGTVEVISKTWMPKNKRKALEGKKDDK